MRFGYFDDKNREYVITTPKTPYPWINYLGSENFFALVSHRAGGYCFYRDARLRRLMRYRYNNVPTDVGGRYFYINDGGEVWNPSFAPTNTALDAFECRHGLGYTRITGERKGVRASLLMLVPQGHTAEIHQLTHRRTRPSEPKNLKVFSLIEWCLWNAYDDMTNYQRNFSTGEVEVESERRDAVPQDRVPRAARSLRVLQRERPRRRLSTPTARSFLGLYNEWGEPQVPAKGQSSNSVASGWSADRVARPGRQARARRGEDVRVHARLRRGAARPEVGEAGRHQQEAGPRR